jgi:hypothetical protein
MGFRQIWRDIINGLLCSSATQVLLNGTLGKKIFHRQGDPLSPILFILVMDVLGHMFSKAAADDMLQPLARRVLPHRISIYADDGSSTPNFDIRGWCGPIYTAWRKWYCSHNGYPTSLWHCFQSQDKPLEKQCVANSVWGEGSPCCPATVLFCYCGFPM